MSESESSKTHERVREVYTRVATRGDSGGDTAEHARRIGYSEQELAAAPEEANERSCS